MGRYILNVLNLSRPILTNLQENDDLDQYESLYSSLKNLEEEGEKFRDNEKNEEDLVFIFQFKVVEVITLFWEFALESSKFK